MSALISIVAPMYNEEQVCPLYIEETMKVARQLEPRYRVEIICVNDGAKDNTLNEMLKAQAKYPDHIGVVNLTRNFGLEGAVNAGLKTATGDAVIVMDADLQDPPELILEMVKKWEKGADIVVASRETRTNDTFFKRTTANIYYKVLDSLSGKLKLENNAANYRLMSRRAVDTVLSLPEVNTYFRVDVPFIGMKTEKVSYNREERAAGVTNYNFEKLVRCALDGLTSISIEPLRKVMLMIPLMLIFLIASIIGAILTTGYWSILLGIAAIISFFFMLLFVVLFIMCEYIGQIMTETRHRPTSLIYSYSPSKNSEKE
jgi:dolichol-phosphate mannosyltransferase